MHFDKMVVVIARVCTDTEELPATTRLELYRLLLKHARGSDIILTGDYELTTELDVTMGWYHTLRRCGYKQERRPRVWIEDCSEFEV